MRPSGDVRLRLGGTVCCWLCQTVLPKMHPPPLRAVASLGAGTEQWQCSPTLSFPGVIASASHVLAPHTLVLCLPHMSRTASSFLHSSQLSPSPGLSPSPCRAGCG